MDFLTERQVVLEPPATTATQLLHQLCDRAGQITGLDVELIHKAVLERERIMHTGLPGGVAVPHARLENLAECCTILCRHRDGVDFDASDGRFSHIIVLILSPAEQPELQLEVMHRTVVTFHDAAVRQRVLDAETPADLLAALPGATE